MTYSEWAKTHEEKRDSLQLSLEQQGLTKEQVIEYFNYDNMVKTQPDFCGLYKANIKCHDMDNLNCYSCACPYFRCSDTPLHTIENTKVFSVCTINSKFSKPFTINNNTHCDCTDCKIPHTTASALKHYKTLPNVEDSSSILETIRNYQLWDILGRLKIF